MLWVICSNVAFAIFAVLVLAVLIIWLCRKGPSKSRLYLAATGAFLIMFTLLFPYYWDSESPAVSRVFLTLHSTAQAFTFDISIKDIVDDIAALQHDGAFFANYSRAISVMSMVCPLFTIGFVLSLLKNFWPRVRLAVHFRKHAYVFSELNKWSLAFAKSIFEKKEGLVVFADAYAREDTVPELLEDAKSIHAICFAKSVDHLPIKKTKAGWARKVHFILISEDESGALSQALELANKYHNRANTRVLLFSSSPTAGKIIDSAQSVSPSLSYELVDKVTSNIDNLWSAESWEDDIFAPKSGFYMQRIDPIKVLAMQTLSDKGLVEFLRDSAARSKKISLMMIGLGGIGKQLLKTAAWLYQIDGYSVEISAFDKRDEAEIQHILMQECPELLDKQLGMRDGDASYDIEIFSGIDCFSSDFESMLRDGDFAERLQRTQAAFVTLGDDDQNIEASIRLRVLFDQIASESVNTEKTAEPLIYSAVYDDEKLENLNLRRPAKNGKPDIQAGNDRQQPMKRDQCPDTPYRGIVQSQIQNHKKEKYNLFFFGSLSSQFSIQTLETIEKRQRKAISCHLSWMVVNHYVRKAFEEDEQFKAKYVELYRERNISEDEIEIYDPLPDTIDKGSLEKTLRNGVQDYYAYEYFRDSSIATSLHKEKIAPLFGMKLETLSERKKRLTALDEDGKGEVTRRRVTEHKRWDAYMRSIGYRYGKKRNDRSLQHNLLVPFNELEPIEQFKD